MKNTIADRLNKNHFLDLGTLQWLVPLFLGLTAFVFEIIEHGLEDDLSFDLAFTSETIIFGMMGPAIVAVIIAWLREIMRAKTSMADQLQALNHELETKVEERTAALAERNLELANANLELQHLDQMKSEFVSLVSHELRAPLTTLNGGLELALQDAASLPPAARRTLEMMVGESARLTKLVQTILDVSRLEAGKLDINIGPLALRPLMEQAAEVVLTPKLRPLEWKFEPDLPPVLADEVHMEEIIRNLMRNAEKYSPAGSPIHLSASQQGSMVRISIKDHGKGIAKEYQQYIFERFGRANSGENAPPGWGLGLYFAHKLVEAQHGSITVNSPIWPQAAAPGAEFVVLVPMADASEE